MNQIAQHPRKHRHRNQIEKEDNQVKQHSAILRLKYLSEFRLLHRSWLSALRARQKISPAPGFRQPNDAIKVADAHLLLASSGNPKPCEGSEVLARMHQPICTVSIEIEPPSNPSTGKRIGSPARRRARI
jgi:hypothetical protein